MTNKLEGKVFITGGAGTLGKAIISKIKSEGWDCDVTVFSRDPMKHHVLNSEFPEVNCMVGDITNYHQVSSAMVGHDIVIHAAAMKHIPEGEDYPIATYDINVNGSINVLEACVANRVKHVVGISTDKACLDWHARIRLADGSYKPIGEIVRDRLELDVMTHTSRGIKTSRIINWHKTKQADRDMIRVSYEHAAYHQRWRRGVWVTEDHPVLVQHWYSNSESRNEWVEAKDLTEKDWLVTDEPMYSYEQESLLIGTLMGDSSLSKSSKAKRYRLLMSHCEKEIDWLKIKIDALSNLGLDLSKLRSYKGQNDIASLMLGCFSYLPDDLHLPKKFRGMPREAIQKILGENIRLTPIFLASWYMDDGVFAKYKTGKKGNARLGTHSYNAKDVDWLALELTDKGYECYSYEVKLRGKSYSELRFSRKGTVALFKSIARYIPPTMRHKIEEGFEDYDDNSWNLFSGGIDFTSPAIITRDNPPPKRDVYCLDIEDTHNFVANGVIVHNCYPINTYGCTKMMMERAFQRYAQLYDTIQFHLVRYGNVLGSTGSVVQVWREMEASEEGIVYATDSEMTRFWLTVEYAVDIILASLSEPSGTICVPILGAQSMKNLAEYVLKSETAIRYEGLRPGEKHHETMLTPEENWFVSELINQDTGGVPFYRLHPVNGLSYDGYPETLRHYNSGFSVYHTITKETLLEMIGDK